MSTYPQTRAVHTVGEPVAGTRGSFDPAEASGETLAVKETVGIEFGVLLTMNNDSDGYLLPTATTTKIYGAAPRAISAGDTATDRYSLNDALTPIRRGYLYCKIDPNNKPAMGTSVRVSYATGKKGWLTSSATDSLAVSGLYVTAVYDTVAEVYFSGVAEYTAAP